MSRAANILISLATLLISAGSVVYETSRLHATHSYLFQSIAIFLAATFCAFTLVAFLVQNVLSIKEFVRLHRIAEIAFNFYLLWLYFSLVIYALAIFGLFIGTAIDIYESGSWPSVTLLAMGAIKGSAMAIIVSFVPATVIFAASAVGIKFDK